MTKFSGSFTGKVNWQTKVSLPHLANHHLILEEGSGEQDCTDAKWKGVIVTYWSMITLVEGRGSSQAYYSNVDVDGDRDWGKFGGTITASGDQITLEGTWKLDGGTGKFEGIKGNGNYKGRMVSPTEVKIEWDGEYEI